MTDIVERLRDGPVSIRYCMEAAAEIERLHAEIEARKTAAEKVYLEQAAEIELLRAALQEIWNELGYMDGDEPHRLCGIARRTLEPKP